MRTGDKERSKKLIKWPLAVIVAMALFVPAVVHAASITWTGGCGDNPNWSCGSNWSGGVVPGAADNVYFNGTSSDDTTIDVSGPAKVYNFTMTQDYKGTITQNRDFEVSYIFDMRQKKTDAVMRFISNADLTFGGFFRNWYREITQIAGSLKFTGQVSCGIDVLAVNPAIANVVVKELVINADRQTCYEYGNTPIVAETSLRLTSGWLNAKVEARGDVIQSAGFKGGTGTVKITGAARSITIPAGSTIGWNFAATGVSLAVSGGGTVAFGGPLNISEGSIDLGSTNVTVADIVTISSGSFATTGSFAILGANASSKYEQTGGTFSVGSYSSQAPTTVSNGNMTVGPGQMKMLNNQTGGCVDSYFYVNGGDVDASAASSMDMGHIIQSNGTLGLSPVLNMCGGFASVGGTLNSSNTDYVSVGTSSCPHTSRNSAWKSYTINKSNAQTCPIQLETANTINVTGNVNIIKGALSAQSGSVRTLLNVGGDWNNTGGVFSFPGAMTVALVGDTSAIRGNNTFYNLTKNTGSALYFEAGKTQVVGGALTLQGAAGANLSLRSTSDGAQWTIDPRGSKAVNYVDVKDSNNAGATAVTASASVNSGNNTGWDFGPRITFDAASSSGSEQTRNVRIPVSLSYRPASDVAVDYTVSGTATGSGVDHNLAAGRLTIRANQNSGDIDFDVNNDSLDEDDETVIVTFTTRYGVEAGANMSHTYTIQDNDAQPTIGFRWISPDGSPTCEESDELDDRLCVFEIRLSEASSKTVTVDYEMVSGTAISGVDYEATSGTFTFAPGDTVDSMGFVIMDDLLIESDETFTARLANATNATNSGGDVAVTIVDDDSRSNFSINDVSVAENGGSATFTVTLSGGGRYSGATVQYGTGGGAATGGADYTASSGTLEFDPYETEKTITVLIADDAVHEGNETFNVTLSSPVNAPISGAIGTGTIIDNENIPTLSISDATIAETEPNLKEFRLTVSLSKPSERHISVDVAAVDGTAKLADGDYLWFDESLLFDPGVTSMEINLYVINDALPESTETFSVILSNPVNAELADDTGTVTIPDDDIHRVLSISDVSVTERDRANDFVIMNFAVSMPQEHVSQLPIGFDVEVVPGGSAVEGTVQGADFFVPDKSFELSGDTATVQVWVLGDTVFEGDETFTLRLTNPYNVNLEGGKSTGIGTIIDNEQTDITISAADVSVDETDVTITMAVVVNLNKTSAAETRVNFEISEGAAKSGVDYSRIPASGELVFAPGETSKPIGNIRIFGDLLDEDNESFSVTLKNSTNATITRAAATVTIRDNDPAPTVTLSLPEGASLDEDGGLVSALAKLSAVSGREVSGSLGFGGTATKGNEGDAGADYFASENEFTIAAGETEATITLGGMRDDIADPAETIIVTGPQNSVTVTIEDDDEPGIAIVESGGSTDVVEGAKEPDGSDVIDTYTVALTSKPSADVTVTLTPDEQISVGVASYTFTPDNWNIGQTVSVSAAEDLVAEDPVHRGVIAHAASSDDAMYVLAANALPRVSVNVTDNDAAAVIVETGGEVVVSENGNEDTFDVSLSSRPARGNVRVAIVSSVPDAATTIPAVLTFQPGQWNVKQTVRVVAFDDHLIEGDHLATLSFVVTSNDPAYNDAAVGNVSVTVRDDDTASVIVTDGDPEVSESGDHDTYNLNLSSVPSADVTVRINTDSQVAVTPTQVTFTRDNWDQIQTIRVSAVDDRVAEGRHASTITHSVQSNDPNYGNPLIVTTQNVTVEIFDDDVASGGDDGGDGDENGDDDAGGDGESGADDADDGDDVGGDNDAAEDDDVDDGGDIGEETLEGWPRRITDSRESGGSSGAGGSGGGVDIRDSTVVCPSGIVIIRNFITNEECGSGELGSNCQFEAEVDIECTVDPEDASRVRIVASVITDTRIEFQKIIDIEKAAVSAEVDTGDVDLSTTFSAAMLKEGLLDKRHGGEISMDDFRPACVDRYAKTLFTDSSDSKEGIGKGLGLFKDILSMIVGAGILPQYFGYQSYPAMLESFISAEMSDAAIYLMVNSAMRYQNMNMREVVEKLLALRNTMSSVNSIAVDSLCSDDTIRANMESDSAYLTAWTEATQSMDEEWLVDTESRATLVQDIGLVIETGRQTGNMQIYSDPYQTRVLTVATRNMRTNQYEVIQPERVESMMRIVSEMEIRDEDRRNEGNMSYYGEAIGLLMTTGNTETVNNVVESREEFVEYIRDACSQNNGGAGGSGGGANSGNGGNADDGETRDNGNSDSANANGRDTDNGNGSSAGNGHSSGGRSAQDATEEFIRNNDHGRGH